MNDQIEKAFNSCFKILKFYGLWINNHKASDNWQIRGILFMIFGLIIFWAMLLAGICKSEISLDLAHSITFFIACSVAIGRIIDCLIEHDSIKKLLESVQNLLKNDVKNDIFIRKRLNFYKKVFVIMIVNAFISVVSGFVISFLSHQFSYPVAVPFDIDKTEIGFYLVNLYLSMSLCFIAPLYTCLGWYPMFFMNFIIGVMEDFNDRLYNFGRKSKVSENTKEFYEIVKTHKKIKDFVREFTRIFKLTFFIKGISGSIILCTALFAIPLVSS